MGFRTPSRREKRADRFDDLASALDAGLSPGSLLGAATTGMVDALDRGGFELSAVDRRIFEAAEQSGELPAALRERAAAERAIASLQRGMLGRLAYPAFLIACAIALSVFVSGLGIGPGPAVPIAVAATLAGAIAAALWSVRRAHGAVELPILLRPFASLLFDYGSIPYLAALRGLYRSGVPIVEAHALASRTAPIGAVRAKLLRAATVLEHQRHALVDALQAQSAVDPDTLAILATAERSGDLEHGLDRALTRRGEVVARRLSHLAKAVGSVCYVVAVAIVAYVVVGFWGSIYGRS